MLRRIWAPFAACFRQCWPKARPLAGRLFWWLGLPLLCLLCALVLAGRYWLLPSIDRYRPALEQQASAILGVPLKIGQLQGDWNSLHPHLAVRDVQLFDAQGQVALNLPKVDAEIGFRSLFYLRPMLHQLVVSGTQVTVRRDVDGHLWIGGIRVNSDQSSGALGDWLMAQSDISVRDAQLSWIDERRKAPELKLTQVQFRLENSGARHRFALLADPPAQWASSLDVRGELHGRNIDTWRTWDGDVYASLASADLTVWRQWVDYPFEVTSGRGGLNVWLGLRKGTPSHLTADVNLDHVVARLTEGSEPVHLLRLVGRLTGAGHRDAFTVETHQLQMLTADGIKVAPTDFRLRWQAPQSGQPSEGELAVNAADLQMLSRLITRLPVEQAWKQLVHDLAPRGSLQNLALSWRGEPSDLKAFSIKGKFSQLGLNARGVMPGFTGMNGEISGDQDKGEFKLDGQGAQMLLPAVFSEPNLKLRQLLVEATWKGGRSGTDISLNKVTFSNDDAIGQASGVYRYVRGHAGNIELNASISKASGGAVWRYMPLVVNADTRNWLRDSVKGGAASGATLELKGDLDKFPFRDNQDGLFRVKAEIAGAQLDYAQGWPQINNIKGRLLFEGQRMLITVDTGDMLGVTLRDVNAEIADLELTEEILTIRGTALGPTQQFLSFVDKSPVSNWIDHFTEGYSAQGNAGLGLGMRMPLRNIATTTLNGKFKFADNRIRPGVDAPLLTDAQGELVFTEKEMSLPAARAKMFGMPVELKARSSAAGGVELDVHGTINAEDLRKNTELGLFDSLSGAAPWRGQLKMRKGGNAFTVESDLVGLSSSLPAPFGKTAREPMKLTLERAETQVGKGKRAVPRDQITLAVGDKIKGVLLLKPAGGLERGVLAINEVPQLPAQGFAVNGTFADIDLDRWRAAVQGKNTVKRTRLDSSPGSAGAIDSVRIKANRATLFGQSVAPLMVKANYEQNFWNATVSSPVMDGRIIWQPEWQGVASGRVVARLKSLTLANAAGPAGRVDAKEDTVDPEDFPAMDVAVESFAVDGKALGKLELKASNKDGVWLVDALNLANPDATLVASGQWTPGGRNKQEQMQLKFSLETPNGGKLLERLGRSQALKGPQTALTGNLTWLGSPLSIDKASLGGNLEISTGKGQFLKLDPGVGRLLGVLSLQSLPRRITLDFRDIFSEGFAFDKVEGSVQINKGLMHTENLQVNGPAAKIQMKGDVSLVAETQNLRVKVQPQIGESLSVGVMLVNPVVGAASFLAQKLLRDPVDKLFAYEYAVSGSWADPKVEKVAAPAQKPVEPALGIGAGGG